MQFGYSSFFFFMYSLNHFLLQDDVFTHLYTLIVNSDNTYEVQIDGEKAESGELEADWDFLPPKKIKVFILFSAICSNEKGCCQKNFHFAGKQM